MGKNGMVFLPLFMGTADERWLDGIVFVEW